MNKKRKGKALRKHARKLGLLLSGKETKNDLVIMLNTKLWTISRNELK